MSMLGEQLEPLLPVWRRCNVKGAVSVEKVQIVERATETLQTRPQFA
jgi:hypothetical protein